MLRATLEIDGTKKAEFNILENDYDSGTTKNYDSKGASDVGSLSEPKEERSAESVIIFDGTSNNASNEDIAQISNVVFSDVVYADYDTMTSGIAEGMYSSAEVGGKVLVDGSPTGDYNARLFSSGIYWDSDDSEMKHLVSSQTMRDGMLATKDNVDNSDEVWAYRLINRVESKVVNKSVAVIVDGIEL